MRAFVLTIIVSSSACAWHKLDVRVCLTEDSTDRKLAKAIHHRYFAEHAPPFQRVHLMPPGGLTRMCDVVATLDGDQDSGSHTASVSSVYSHQELVVVTSTGTVIEAARAIGAQLYAAFDRGTPLHERIVAERSKH